jgi:hypothetical protein
MFAKVAMMLVTSREEGRSSRWRLYETPAPCANDDGSGETDRF